jgi:neutral ceramidase
MKFIRCGASAVNVLGIGLSLALTQCGDPGSDEDGNGVEEASSAITACQDSFDYNIGAGMGDITGPFVGSSTGFNSPGDQMSGLAMRLYARAFVIESPCTGKSIIYVSADMLHLYQSVKVGVVKKLQSEGLGALYTTDNVMLSATHTHAAPSNTSWRTLFNAFNGVIGFDEVHYNIVVNGIVEAIKKAHAAKEPGRIKFARGRVENGAYNRSLAAYSANADAGNYDNDVDDAMTVLRLEGNDGSEIGMINWFGVHGTSADIHNRRVHGDNKGWASYEFERRKGTGFVAAFGQSVMGDVSPSTPDPTDRTKPFQRPSALDPSLTSMDDVVIEGTHQLDAAWQLYHSATTLVHGGIDYRHTHRDFNSLPVDARYVSGTKPWDDLSQVTTCTAVVGGGFLAGDEEGSPTDNVAREGQIKNSYALESGRWVQHKYDLSEVHPAGGGGIGAVVSAVGVLWPVAELALHTNQYDACQKEKFALLPVGKVDDFWFPAPRVPFIDNIIPLQIAVVGDVGIIATPFELSTMVGRHVKETLAETLRNVGIPSTDRLVIAGIANSYAQYMTTREEYAEQNFEGSFDYFGPFADAALRQELDRIATDFANGRPSDSGPNPPDLSGYQLIETPLSTNGVMNDDGRFGRVLSPPQASYSRTRDTVVVRFQAAHPQTILDRKLAGELGKYYDPDTYTFLEVQRKTTGGWVTVYADRDPYTSFDWQRTGGDLSPTSEATITWTLRNETAGTYRIVYNGLAKKSFLNLFPSYVKFTGISPEFAVL